MSPQVALALGIVIATMVAAYAGVFVRRGATSATPSLPHWIIVTLIVVGAILSALVAVGLLFILSQ